MLSFFPRDILDEILNLIESVSEGFPTYSNNKIFFIYMETIKAVWHALPCETQEAKASKASARSLFPAFRATSWGKLPSEFLVRHALYIKGLLSKLSQKLKRLNCAPK